MGIKEEKKWGMRERSYGSQKGLNPQFFCSWQIFSSGHRGFSRCTEVVMSLGNTAGTPHIALASSWVNTPPKTPPGIRSKDAAASLAINNQDNHWNEYPHFKEKEIPSLLPSKNLHLSPNKWAETHVACEKKAGQGTLPHSSPSTELNSNSLILSHKHTHKHTQNTVNGSVFL